MPELEIKEGIQIYNDILGEIKPEQYKGLLTKKWVSLDSLKEMFKME